MCYKLIIKEKNLTVSRIKKKHLLKKISICNINSSFYLIALKYSFIKHFCKQQQIKLNSKILSKLITEELSTIFSFLKWTNNFFKKLY